MTWDMYNAPIPPSDGRYAVWHDGSTSWQDLLLLKELHPIEMAEFAVSQGISNEPAFNWWVPHTLRKREAIIKLALSCNA